ncbi:MAG: hypothetical protein NZ823_04460, partial [Blastocatellia bacterium]|nr:hypothetical protein [Blastocatellia bacterium]
FPNPPTYACDGTRMTRIWPINADQSAKIRRIRRIRLISVLSNSTNLMLLAADCRVVVPRCGRAIRPSNRLYVEHMP